MAASEAVSAMAGTVNQVMNKMVDMTEKAQKAAAAQPAPPPPPPPGAADAARSAMDMAKEVFTVGLNLGKGAVQGEAKAQVEAIQTKLDVLEKSTNPQNAMAQVREVVSLLRELQPAASAGGSGSGQEDRVSRLIDDFMKREANLQAQITQMNSERVAALERQLISLQQNPPSSAHAKDDLSSTLDKILSMKDKLQDAFGGGEPTKEERVPAWMALAQSAMAGLPTLATAILGASYNIAIAKTGQGQPIPPGLMPAPDASLLPGGDNPNPNPNSDPGDAMRSYYMVFLRQIERPLINHLNDASKTGADFAAWVTDGYGDVGYQSAKEMGKDALLALLMSHPPIAQVIQQIPSRADAFLEEFIHADEADDNPDNGEDAPPTQPPTQPRPQIVDVGVPPRKTKRAHAPADA